MVKVFAIGNRLMSDDKIGLLIGEKLINDLKEYQVNVFICETDIGYALSNIQEKDFLLIIDAVHTGRTEEEIKLIPIDSIEGINIYTQHSLSLIQLIKLYHKDVTGYIIGIEAEDIDYGLGISKKLSKSFNKTYSQVIKMIKLFINR